ncbi:hypothetical protein D3C72_1449110 [compost metagenome]
MIWCVFRVAGAVTHPTSAGVGVVTDTLTVTKGQGQRQRQAIVGLPIVTGPIQRQGHGEAFEPTHIEVAAQVSTHVFAGALIPVILMGVGHVGAEAQVAERLAGQ